MKNRKFVKNRLLPCLLVSVLMAFAVVPLFAVNVSASDIVPLPPPTGCIHDWYELPSGARMCLKCSARCSVHTYQPVCQPYDETFHNTVGVCDTCGKIIGDTPNAEDTSLSGHIFDNNNVCTFCSYACEHYFSKGSKNCYYCGMYHRECTEYELVTDFENGLIEHYSYVCSVCGDSVFNSDNPSMNFFRPAPFFTRWNCELTSILFEEYINGSRSYYRPYQRFTPSVYDSSIDYKATVYLTDGVETFESGINADRYLFMRVRLHDVEWFELSVFADYSPDVVVGSVPGTGSGSYKTFVIDVSNVIEDEWITLVFDLSAFDCYDNTYGNKLLGYRVDEFINCFSAYLCARFGSADGFIDYEFFSVVDSLDYVDRTIHFHAYTNHTELYYLYDNNGINLISKTHSFLGERCRNCGAICKHTSYINSRCDSCGLFAKVDGYDNEMGFFSLFSSIYDAQVNTFFSILGYEIFGVNVATFILSVLTLVISIFVLKKVL